MHNPFREAMGGNQVQSAAGRNYAPDLLHYIQGFKGNPIQAVQGKLQSGEWTQEQYNEVRKAAEQVAQKMRRMFR